LLYRSASGGAEHINIFKEANINTSLKYLKSNNFWISAFDAEVEKKTLLNINGREEMYCYLDLKVLVLNTKL
jgi:tRNA G18 (ribose-2'-O)-methylase SpoU